MLIVGQDGRTSTPGDRLPAIYFRLTGGTEKQGEKLGPNIDWLFNAYLALLSDLVCCNPNVKCTCMYLHPYAAALVLADSSNYKETYFECLK